jgi:hypothetical protein
MTKATSILVAALTSGFVRRLSGSTQAVYYSLAIMCGDGPRALSAETIAYLSGLSVRTTEQSLSALFDCGAVECVPFHKRGRRDKYTGRYFLPDPAKFAEMDSPKRAATLRA